MLTTESSEDLKGAERASPPLATGDGAAVTGLRAASFRPGDRTCIRCIISGIVSRGSSRGRRELPEFLVLPNVTYADEEAFHKPGLDFAG